MGKGSLRAGGMVRLSPGGAETSMTSRPPNPLLVRDDVGKAKVSSYALPDEHFSFGRASSYDTEGAREVSMRWVHHTPSLPPEEPADFVQANKRTVGNKHTTARDMKFHRKEQNVSGLATMTPRGGLNTTMAMATPRNVAPNSARAASTSKVRDVIPSDVVPDFTYGRKVRPSTPIQDVVSARYAERAERELNQFYTEHRQNLEAARMHVRKIPLTVASRGHASAVKKAELHQEKAQDLFKIRKFKTQGTRIDNGKPKIMAGVDWPQRELEDLQTHIDHINDMDPAPPASPARAPVNATVDNI